VIWPCWSLFGNEGLSSDLADIDPDPQSSPGIKRNLPKVSKVRTLNQGDLIFGLAIITQISRWILNESRSFWRTWAMRQVMYKIMGSGLRIFRWTSVISHSHALLGNMPAVGQTAPWLSSSYSPDRSILSRSQMPNRSHRTGNARKHVKKIEISREGWQRRHSRSAIHNIAFSKLLDC
jgi:hypothetical protein